MATSQSVETKTFVVVGVDFGTTYTGVAYTLSDDPNLERITIIESWPGAGLETRPKVPTEISYEESAVSRWGWQLRAGSNRYGGFKLLLDPGAGSQAYSDEQLALTLDPGNPSTLFALYPGKSAEDMATDYLRMIYREVMAALGMRFSKTLKTLKLRFVITTPAMWSPAAQHNTLMAAKAAGFGQRPQDIAEVVTEPEAASSYALKDIGNWAGTPSIDNPCGWQVGKQVIVCDAGGGTVDLVSYAIDQTSPYLRVSETTPPQGGLCGATSLDQRFLQLLRLRLGRQADLLDGAHAGRGSRLMRSFEDAKRNFRLRHKGGDEEDEDEYDKEYYETDDEIIEHGMRDLVPDYDRGLHETYITLSKEEMKSIFDPVVENIISLLETVFNKAQEKHPKKPVIGIILVGGFGESRYLSKRLKGWAKRRAKSKAEPPAFVCNPTKSWAAIAIGAVCFGLEGIVQRRVLPCHYGVVFDHPHNPSIHDPAYTYFDEFDKITMNSDTMTWFAKMGETSDQDHRITVPFSSRPYRDRNTRMTIKLRTCRYNEPPKSRRDSKILMAPSITVNLGTLPASAFSTKRVGGFFIFGGEILYQADFTLVMITGSASFKFEIYHGGTLLATQEVDPLFVGFPNL